ncbi:YheC/YheD family endospore coat-associated protein [Effusibacillus pohliae]|uniref:YheC/YheD family endospore coat-associated protein n=1 Tax=Effusibacillus pohliae TaxID=232270 RepID=UPI00035D993B|nr:YheC/YheD family protein [Effusibacillus pohliae]
MKTIPITVTSVSSEHRGYLFLSKTVCNQLGIRPGQHEIQCGGVHLSVRVAYPMHENSSICTFSPDVIESLALLEDSRLFLYKTGEMLRIGPVFAIFANVRVKNGEIAGQQGPIFEHLLSLATEERMFAYVFGPQDVTSNKLQGYILHKANGRRQWDLRSVPFPDVVYDQIITRKFENRPDVKAVKQQLLKRLGAAYFNPGFFDKAQVHQWLSARDETKGYLPATILHEDVKRTAVFLERYNPVYLKPINGSKGIGIIKLMRLADGHFFYQIKGKQGIPVQGVQKSPAEVLRKLQPRMKKRAFLAQEGLQLKTYQGRPFDIRVLVQKDETGAWKRTKMFCRIAQAGDITSNLSTGGDALAVAKVLREIYPNPEQTRRILRKIRKLVGTVPTVLEEVSGQQYGEIGLDIGIDTKGWVWIIEVNSKPWKKPFTEQGSMKLVLQSFRRPLLYGKYLAGIT